VVDFVRRPRHLIIGAIALVLIAGLGAAWWFESRAPASDYAFKVMRGDRVLASYDVAQVKAIGSKQIMLQGKVQEGASLLAVLEHAGAGTFTTVTIVGANVSTGKADQIVLAACDIGPDTVLDPAPKRLTVKIAGPKIPRNSRIRDITEIVVK